LLEAVILLSILDGLAITVTKSDEAKMNEIERGIIAPALQRVIDRLPSAYHQIISVYSDPFLLLTGLIMWGGRLNNLAKAQKETDQAVQAVEEKSTVTKPAKPPTNGTEPSVEPSLAVSNPNLIAQIRETDYLGNISDN
jgi:NDP-sugar pyrophosphorylase family protein